MLLHLNYLKTYAYTLSRQYKVLSLTLLSFQYLIQDLKTALRATMKRTYFVSSGSAFVMALFFANIEPSQTFTPEEPCDDIMKTSQTGLNLIKHHEGYRARVYYCAAGRRTVGYGHVIKRKEKIPKSITPKTAENLLRKDVKHAEQAVIKLVKVPLNQNQFDALVSFTYNTGTGALARSNLLKKVNKKAHKAVPAEFKKWSKAGRRRLKGLKRRRLAEAQLYIA